MRYVVLIATDPTRWEKATPAERRGYVDARTAFEREVAARGTRVSGAPLASADTATTLRHGADGLTVTDGPFVELVEQLAGFYLVDLPDLDAAVATSAVASTRWPATTTPPAVRRPHSGQGQPPRRNPAPPLWFPVSQSADRGSSP